MILNQANATAAPSNITTNLHNVGSTKENDMTLQEIKHMQATRRKQIRTVRDALRKMHNTHDPHDMHAWANNKPMWLLPLQVLGAMATGIGLVACIYYSTLILFLL